MRARFGRAILGGALAAAAIGLPACKKQGGPATDSAAAPGDRLRRPWAAEPANAVPFVEPADGYSQLLGRYIYEGLAAIDPRTGKVEPALATRLDVSPDGLRVQASLRPGVAFHDGTKLTAKDVLATFRAVRAADGPAPTLRAVLADLADVRTPSEGVIEFEWKKASARALRVLADVVIVPARIADGGFQKIEARRWAPGTGAYFLAEWSTTAIRIARNKSYWGRPPDLPEAVFRIIADPADQLAAFKKGELDLVPVPPALFAAERDALSNDPRWRVLRYPRSRYDVLYLNLRRKPLSDVKLRRALAALVDRAAAAKAFGAGAVIPIAGPVLPGTGGIAGFEPPPAVDAAAAQKLVDEARPGKARALLRLVDGNAEVSQAVVELAKQLGASGASIDTEAAEPRRHRLYLQERTFDIGYATEQASLDIDPWSIWHTGGAENRAGYSNPKVDDLLDRARATIDDVARGKLLDEARAIIADDVPAITLWRHTQVMLLGRELENVEPAPLTGLDDIRSWRINRRK